MPRAGAADTEAKIPKIRSALRVLRFGLSLQDLGPASAKNLSPGNLQQRDCTHQATQPHHGRGTATEQSGGLPLRVGAISLGFAR